MQYVWDFHAPLRESSLLVAGALGTLKLAASALALAVILGFALALIRMANKPIISSLAVAYIDFFRASSLLVLIFWFFYAFPILVHIDIDAFTAATLAIGLQASASFAELFRGGIVSISPGQWDAAKAVGMNYPAAMRYVVLPQAIRRMLPVFFTLSIETFKGTSLASAIAVSELSYNASRISSDTYRPIETFTIVGLMYFVFIFGASNIMRWVERRLAVSDH